MASESVTAASPRDLYMGPGLLQVAILEDSAGDLADHATRLSYIAACLQRVVHQATEDHGDPPEMLEYARQGVELINHLAHQMNIETCEALRSERRNSTEFVEIPVIGKAR